MRLKNRVPKFQCGLEARLLGFAQGPGYDGDESRRETCVDGAEVWRIDVQLRLRQRIVGAVILTAKRYVPDQGFIKRDAKTVQVGTRVHFFAQDLLRRHVLQSAWIEAGAGLARLTH